MPSSLCGRNEVKFGMWGFYHLPNNLREKGLNLEKKFFLNNPSVYVPIKKITVWMVSGNG